MGSRCPKPNWIYYRISCVKLGRVGNSCDRKMAKGEICREGGFVVYGRKKGYQVAQEYLGGL